MLSPLPHSPQPGIPSDYAKASMGRAKVASPLVGPKELNCPFYIMPHNPLLPSRMCGVCSGRKLLLREMARADAIWLAPPCHEGQCGSAIS